MTIHFAAARNGSGSPLARALKMPAIGEAMNDNGQENGDPRLVHAALRHFGECGMGAARQAYLQAEAAFFAGDRASYDWWLAICRTLDRRLAAEFARKVEAGLEQAAPAIQAGPAT